MRKRFTLISLVALLLMATVPGVAFAARAFTAGGGIVRVDPGTVSFPPALGGAMLTENQVFVGSLSSDWKQLNGADIVVNQNSAIGADVPSLLTTGVGALFGQAWGSFTVTNGQDSLVGSYGANLSGWVFVDQTGACPATTILSPFPVPLGIVIEDAGGWSAIEGTPDGAYNAINEAGGGLIAGAQGCIGGDEFATVSITGSLGQTK
jgi:hypothetical protein